MTPKVDIHCHNFNADDLPVRGFVEQVIRDPWLVAVARGLDLYAQRKAPGFEEAEDLWRRLDDGPEPASALREALEAEVEAALQDVSSMESTFNVGIAEIPEPELRDRIRFAKTLLKSRYEITALMAEQSPDVDIFTPSLVDLAHGVTDRPSTTAMQQVVLQDLVSRLSIRGHFNNALILPFVGFDPWQEYIWRWRRSGPSPLRVVRESVERHGFCGVKIYPPMGFKPIGNDLDVTCGDKHAAARLDGIMHDLYSVCTDLGIPILAHGNASNEASSGWKTYSHVRHWESVLSEHKDLKVCIGHAGGMMNDDESLDRVQALAQMTDDHPGLYCDFSNHPIHGRDEAKAFLSRVDELARTHQDFPSRIMFGSDWLMLEMSPARVDYLVNYVSLVKQTEELDVEGFAGGNALRFLVSSKQRERLASRFSAEGADPPAWLAA